MERKRGRAEEREKEKEKEDNKRDEVEEEARNAVVWGVAVGLETSYLLVIIQSRLACEGTGSFCIEEQVSTALYWLGHGSCDGDKCNE